MTEFETDQTATSTSLRQPVILYSSPHHHVFALATTTSSSLLSYKLQKCSSDALYHGRRCKLQARNYRHDICAIKAYGVLREKANSTDQHQTDQHFGCHVASQSIYKHYLKDDCCLAALDGYSKYPCQNIEYILLNSPIVGGKIASTALLSPNTSRLHASTRICNHTHKKRTHHLCTWSGTTAN